LTLWRRAHRGGQRGAKLGEKMKPPQCGVGRTDSLLPPTIITPDNFASCRHSFTMQSFRPTLGSARDPFSGADDVEVLRGLASALSARSPARELAAIQDSTERRDLAPARLIGHLVSLDGMRGVISCRLENGDEDWSVGHLITIVNRTSRVVGVVCEIATADGNWTQGGANAARVMIEFYGEIIDDASGAPVFYRGIRSFPPLGSITRQIRADDLQAIYSFRGRRGIQIGRLSQNNAISADIDVNELIGRHFAVLGSTGVGKTTSVSLLLKKSVAAKPNLRIMVFDPHNEYAAHFPNLAQVIDSDTLELPFWMFRFDEFADVVFSGRQPHPEERDALYEVIRIARAKYLTETGSTSANSALRRQPAAESAPVTSDTPTPYRVIDALAAIDDWLGKLDQRFSRTDLRALRFRLEALNRDPRFRFMFGRPVVEDDIGKVISRLFRIPMRGLPITIVRLAGLPNEVVNSVVSVIARLAFEIAFFSSGSFEITVLCEEAHRYVPAGHGQAFAPARLAIGRIAKEGRKYGASLGVVSQRPSELDATVLSQCSTVFAMRLANEIDKGIIRAAAGVSAGSAITFLSSMADREAIAFGEANPTPMRMKFADISDEGHGSPPPDLGQRDTRPIDLRKLSSQLRGEAA
jgi:uncharacterized protein